jgi:hypothetical protein
VPKGNTEPHPILTTGGKYHCVNWLNLLYTL